MIWLRAALVAAGVVLTTAAAAAGWAPERSIRIVVPFAAGGPSDTIARIIADEMTLILDKPVYIDNIGGGGGSKGTLQFLKEARDGHTLLMGHMGTHGAAPAMNNKLGYDPVADFSPIGLAAGTPVIVTVRKDLGVSDMKTLQALMRERGKDVRLAHAGKGSVSHAAAILLTSILKCEATFVSYNGTGPALNDLAAGKVDVLVDQLVNVAPMIALDQVMPLAIASHARSDIVPDVPTTSEAGIHMHMEAWNALFASRGTPQEEVSALNEALRRTLESPPTRARLLDLGAEIPNTEAGSPQALAGLVAAEIKRWAETVYNLR